MRLWILRHGQAEAHAATDAERNLTAHGRQQVLASAARLIGQPIDGIVASPYVRAQQTADLVREALGFAGDVRTVSWLTPDTNPLKALEQLDSAQNLLLVSHQPLVGSLIGLLQHGHLRDPQAMDTASLAELQGDWPLAGSLTLVRVSHP
ncbi:MAG: phosphohistidine phosphatase SixA [Pseudomonas sp.]|uniref:phosphohistidine phosphatase SixA n=1 Tax=unclassified Pseudomonas TaxID=196821 RepID=UPI0007313838|nr:phosphohistidine phosphatase SixA [Pseudomonas sp. L5B5]KTC37833.1 phosphohistidine phosphatase [Pseudomonas sp. ABAC61]UCZ86643.1 phosphohistidine phosphatase SixA [Pseudomonas sp. L5B5]